MCCVFFSTLLSFKDNNKPNIFLSLYEAQNFKHFLLLSFTALKKLKKLNLSCCRQITNKVIPVLNGKSLMVLAHNRRKEKYFVMIKG